MKIKLLILLFCSIQVYCQNIGDSISYSLDIENYKVQLTVPLQKDKWIKNNFLGIEQAYYNDDLDLQLIFNKDLLKTSVNNHPSEGISYLLNNFNSEYDENKAFFTYSPNKKVYKCIYKDFENSFIIYLYFYNNYIIYTAFYSRKDNESTGVLSIDNELFLDKIYFNAELKKIKK